jgi:hypothetical protein
VAQLFALTGKPVLLQAPKSGAASTEDASPLPPIAFPPNETLSEGNDLWCAHHEFNALFHFSLADKELNPKFLGSFPGEDLFAKNLYRKPARIGNKLIFAPNTAKNIAVFDMDSGAFEMLDLPPVPSDAPPVKEGTPLFAYAVAHGSEVYFFRQGYFEHLRLDMETLKLDGAFLLHGGIGYMQVENSASFALRFAPLQVDYYKGEHKHIELSIRQLWAFQNGDDFWRVPHLQGPPVRWNRATNAFQVFEQFPAGFNKLAPRYFTASCFAGGFVWLLCQPQTNCTLIRLDPNTGDMVDIPLFTHLNARGTLHFVASTEAAFFLQLRPSLEMVHIRCPDGAFLLARFYSRYGEDFPLRYLWGTVSGAKGFIRTEGNPPWQTIDGLLQNLPALQNQEARQKAESQKQFANADGTAGAKIFSKLKACISNPLTVPSTGAKAMNGA